MQAPLPTCPMSSFSIAFWPSAKDESVASSGRYSLNFLTSLRARNRPADNSGTN
jgi:hypothetical protein